MSLRLRVPERRPLACQSLLRCSLLLCPCVLFVVAEGAVGLDALSKGVASRLGIGDGAFECLDARFQLRDLMRETGWAMG